MKVVCDIETNALVNPSKIWVIACKNIDTGELSIFRRVTDDEEERKRFLDYASKVSHWIGHNWLEFDWPVLCRFFPGQLFAPQIRDMAASCTDTLIVSKLVDYSRSSSYQADPQAKALDAQSSQSGRTVATVHSGTAGILQQPGVEPVETVAERIRTKLGHSIEAYGVEFGFPKLDNKGPSFFKQWSQELEDYCVRDVEICSKIYHKYRNIIQSTDWRNSILTEHRFQLVVNDLHTNGFSFNVSRANNLLSKVTSELEVLDKDILEAFPPKEVLIREFVPKLTKFGTISRTSVPRLLWPNIHQYTAGQAYRHTRLEPFNPASHKQVIEVLNGSGWKPSEKTVSHIEVEREINRLKYGRSVSDERSEKLSILTSRLDNLKITGWKINEVNLSTLPPTAPAPARLLAKRILLESRRRTLTEWLGLVKEDGRIHGKFYGIGAWTHRMAHQEPNTANIPNSTDINGKTKLLGKEMRALWQAPKGRLLVGVDAEGIQLRIFAHLIDDKEFTKSLVEGRKDEKTDPHSLNKNILGSVCKTRAAAKRFIYALLLGGGISKLANILECSVPEAEEALVRVLERYEGFRKLKEDTIPRDARNGYFIGLDGRKVKVPGETVGDRRHLMMSGYLQNGEAVVMKLATLIWYPEVCGEKEEALVLPSQSGDGTRRHLFTRPRLVNFVHDEWQVETKNDLEEAIRVAKAVSRSLGVAGDRLGLRVPMTGSYWNDDARDYTIGTNWSVTH